MSEIEGDNNDKYVIHMDRLCELLVFLLQSQINHMIWHTLTFITVTNSIKIDVVTFVAEEEKTEPRIKWINGNNEKNAYNPALLIGTCIVPQL